MIKTPGITPAEAFEACMAAGTPSDKGKEGTTMATIGGAVFHAMPDAVSLNGKDMAFGSRDGVSMMGTPGGRWLWEPPKTKLADRGPRRMSDPDIEIAESPYKGFNRVVGLMGASVDVPDDNWREDGSMPERYAIWLYDAEDRAMRSALAELMKPPARRVSDDDLEVVEETEKAFRVMGPAGVEVWIPKASVSEDGVLAKWAGEKVHDAERAA